MLSLAAVFLIGIAAGVFAIYLIRPEKIIIKPKALQEYWLILNRSSNIEKLYKGVAGDKSQSVLVKTFTVKTGIPGQTPTPLPQLLGRKYWKIIKKYPSVNNPETAPYFMELDIPVNSEWPYGPTPYAECTGSVSAGIDGQCNWEFPGYFGLHGINGDISRLSSENPGSFGCIRHKDEDIAYLYELLTPEKEEIRYYIEDI